jgi:uncharacterized repeat protein (TIGR01451 family)
MSRQGRHGGVGPADLVIAALAIAIALAAATSLRVKASTQDRGGVASPEPAQAPAPPQAPPNVTPGVPMAPPPSPGTAVIGPIMTPEGHTAEGPPPVPPSVQVVRFQGPPGLKVDVLAPTPYPAPVGDGGGIITLGLERGVGYRLRLTDITERPGAELFPVIEVVGHLHRPREIDPGKYPIRVVFTDEELWGVIDRGRLVTKVIYLEDPEQAIPLKLQKDQIPQVTLNPTEEPLKVAQALGRVMAIVRIGGRRPTPEELQAGATGDVVLDSVASIGNIHCPFSNPGGEACSLPCGPVCGTPPPPGRPWLPKDEYLCDGGDQGTPAAVAGDGNLRGIDPRDAVMQFDVGLDDLRRHRVLPTNRVCVYAPRFAEVEISTGTNEAVEVHAPSLNRAIDKYALAESRSGSRRLVQHQAAELARQRRRAQDLDGRVFTGETSKMQAIDEYNNVQQVKTGSQQQPVQIARNRAKPALMKEKIRLDGIKTAESPVISGVVEGLSQSVMSWQPHSMTGVETPPNRPGMAIIKRVSAMEAEPGDTVTFVITYRNMGNTPIRTAAIVDSLLSRLEYVKGSAKGPKGTTFSSAENRVGSTELRWELPGVIAPGASGHVSFEAVVR